MLRLSVDDLRFIVAKMEFADPSNAERDHDLFMNQDRIKDADGMSHCACCGCPGPYGGRPAWDLFVAHWHHVIRLTESSLHMFKKLFEGAVYEAKLAGTLEDYRYLPLLGLKVEQGQVIPANTTLLTEG